VEKSEEEDNSPRDEMMPESVVLDIIVESAYEML
jgi:hypothetical protein